MGGIGGRGSIKVWEVKEASQICEAEKEVLEE